MDTSYKDLFKLYDVIQNGNERTLESILKDTPIQINQIIPCKGIGVLHLAVGIEPEDKSKKCTELLLKHGGDPNLCNEEGVTPVHIAAIWGRVDNLKLLVACGGDPARRDHDGHSAFDYAARDEQWAVFDYLHNVEDHADDALLTNCAYTLGLERILLTTDQIVAEYGPIIEENAQEPPAARKSELINEWCERNSLAINKLYPTILGDTYLIDDETAPWKSTCIDLSDNITLDLTTHRTSTDTHASFKSCLSTKPTDVQISGVQPIDMTLDETSQHNSHVLNKRISVYDNFSLPGSPKTISHINYNTKSSLKKKHQCNSLISSDCSQELDKVLADVQNRTNEFLSTSKRGAGNTRRSSASSGVSSRHSGASSRHSGVSSRHSGASSGSVLLAAVHEEYRYTDRAEDVVLIEKRLRVSPVVLPVGEGAEQSAVSAVSAASSLPAAVHLDDRALRAELVRLGFAPGPIQDTTRNLYLKKLHTLRKQPRADDAGQLADRMHNLHVNGKQQKKTYSIEIEKSLRNAEWMDDLSAHVELERAAREGFAAGAPAGAGAGAPAGAAGWRGGGARTAFTYLLLDPRRSRNLPARAAQLARHDAWTTFVDSIFYVGKGKRSRPYSHLYQALTLWKKEFRTSKDKKVQRILDIWCSGAGVVCLHVFQNVLAAEAYSHEAAMLDALGLGALTNVRPGNYYGAVAAWPLRQRRMLGTYLLYKAMHIFLNEGERQLRPDDLD